MSTKNPQNISRISRKRWQNFEEHSTTCLPVIKQSSLTFETNWGHVSVMQKVRRGCLKVNVLDSGLSGLGSLCCVLAWQDTLLSQYLSPPTAGVKMGTSELNAGE